MSMTDRPGALPMADEPAGLVARVLPSVHIVIVALVAAVAVLAWLVVFTVGNRLLWENEVVLANPWLFPVICLPFSLLVGLLVKYRNAPTTLNESMLDSLSGDVSEIRWRTLPVNVVMAWASLFSGAVLGPEGGIGGIASKIAALYGEKAGVPEEARSRLVFSAIASAFNGLVANPLFTGVLGAELISDRDARVRNFPATLVGGSLGFLVFAGFGLTGLQDYLALTPADGYEAYDVVVVVLCGFVGLALAMVSGAFMRVASAFFGRFQGREVERALVAGLIFSAVGMVAPILLFSGETQIREIAADPAAYGPAALVGMAVVKLALLAVAFRSGFLGGPTFPAIFAAVSVGLATSLLLPGLPVEVILGGIMAGFLVVLFKAPLMVILLTTVMLGATPDLIALIVLATAAVMMVLPSVMAAVTKRRPAATEVAEAAEAGEAGTGV